jgi:hypothetical protein
MGSYALLVSTDRYADPTLRQLRSPRADVEALAAVLADPRVQASAFSRYGWLVRSGRVVWSWCGAGTNFRDHAVLTAP